MEVREWEETQRRRRDSLIKRITQSKNVRRATGISSFKSSSGELEHSQPRLDGEKRSRLPFDTHIHVRSVKRTRLSRTEARERTEETGRRQLKRRGAGNHSCGPRGGGGVEESLDVDSYFIQSATGRVIVNTSDCAELHGKPTQADSSSQKKKKNI